MKKVIKLTELDLARIVKRVIKEQSQQPTQTQQTSVQGRPVSTNTQQIPKITDNSKLEKYLNWNPTGELSKGISILEKNGAKIAGTPLSKVSQDVSVVSQYLSTFIRNILTDANTYGKNILTMSDPAVLMNRFKGQKIDNKTQITFDGFYNDYLSKVGNFWTAVGNIQETQRNLAMRS